MPDIRTSLGTSRPEDENDGPDAGTQQYQVKSLSRGLALLKLFDVEHARWTLSDVVRASGMHKATCYRLLRTLEQEGFLMSDAATGEYGLGPALTRLAILAESGDELVRTAQPFLERLVEITGETVDMTVWNEAGPLLVAQVLSRSRQFQPMNSVGTVFTESPATHVKLWLAFGTAAQQARMRSVLTPDRNGIALSGRELEDTVEHVRRDGVAFDVAELREVFAVGAPVMDAAGRMVAGIAVVASFSRTTTTERDLCAAAVKQVARELSRALGAAPAPAHT
jgi:IclR family pca regulon transcriptional regulator